MWSWPPSAIGNTVDESSLCPEPAQRGDRPSSSGLSNICHAGRFAWLQRRKSTLLLIISIAAEMYVLAASGSARPVERSVVLLGRSPSDMRASALVPPPLKGGEALLVRHRTEMQMRTGKFGRGSLQAAGRKERKRKKHVCMSQAWLRRSLSRLVWCRWRRSSRKTSSRYLPIHRCWLCVAAGFITRSPASYTILHVIRSGTYVVGYLG